MGLCLRAASRLGWWNERLGKMPAPSQAPNTALKRFVSCAFPSPAASLDAHGVRNFSLRMNNPAYRTAQKTSGTRRGLNP
jgi:hypothetical protein